jgi:glycosyltransferase involved in cell wall biosynthesis
MQNQKRLLIISMGPFPTPEHPEVEGGGLRCWGLACGLRGNSPELEITLSFLDVFKKPDHTAFYQGFPITTWNSGQLAEQVADYDAVLVSYCMGDASVRVADSLRPDQQLILDCYVPIYVEVSARDSSDFDREYAAFMTDMKYWNKTLLRGDVFLCASAQQKRFYQGVLAAMGRINPITYGKQLILEVPYGIHRQEPVVRNRPISALLGDSLARKILWFGGIYPWFDLTNLIDAVAIANRHTPTRLAIVGAKNPFTQHPDFLEKHRQLEAYAQRPELDGLVFMQDWVHFDDRANWYLDADLVVVVNKRGDENQLSWRTRLVDLTWANVPILTNGGDPLGEELITAGAAARISSLEPTDMARMLVTLLEDPAELARIKARLHSYKKGLFWDVVTQGLAHSIAAGTLAPDLQDRRPQTLVHSIDAAETARPNRLRTIFYLACKLPAYIRKHGLRFTALRVRAKVGRHLDRFLPERKPSGPRIVVLAHRLDLSGAPFVLLDVLERTVSELLPAPVVLYSYPPVHQSHLSRLRSLGLKVNLILDTAHSPQFEPGDVVLMNTVGFKAPVRNAVLEGLESKRIKKVLWYIHEDEPELLFCPVETRRMRHLMQKGLLVILTPAHQTCEHFRRHFAVEVLREPIRVDHPEIHQIRDPQDFETLRFVLPGAFGDGRKGQLSIMYALATFYLSCYSNHPELYRDFTITFVGLEDDFLSRQVQHHQKILGERLICHPKVTRDLCLKIIGTANVTICYSLREALPKFVYEGMLAGHPLLRNDCSGMEEQLENGRNGFLLESTDFWQVVQTFERILDRRQTTNEQLAAMSARSHQIALGMRDNRYDQIIDMIGSSFRDGRTALKGPHFDRPKPRVRATAGSGGTQAHL